MLCQKKNVFDNLDQAFGFFNQKTIFNYVKTPYKDS